MASRFGLSFAPRKTPTESHWRTEVNLSQPLPAKTNNDSANAARLVKACAAIREQVGQVVVGQDSVIEQLLIAILSRGHCLLEGVPGLAKTLMIRTLAESMDLDFKRIQFTPDLMPGDITGTDIIQEDPETCLLYTSPSPRDQRGSRMPSSA